MTSTCDPDGARVRLGDLINCGASEERIRAARRDLTYATAQVRLQEILDADPKLTALQFAQLAGTLMAEVREAAEWMPEPV